MFRESEEGQTVSDDKPRVLGKQTKNRRLMNHWVIGSEGLKALHCAAGKNSKAVNLQSYAGMKVGQVFGAVLLSDFESFDRRGKP